MKRDVKSHFIRTNDPFTASKLKEMGFTQINDCSGMITFLNNTSFAFEKLDLPNMHMTFTNVFYA